MTPRAENLLVVVKAVVFSDAIQIIKRAIRPLIPVQRTEKLDAVSILGTFSSSEAVSVTRIPGFHLMAERYT